MKVAILGPKGTYTHEVANKFLEGQKYKLSFLDNMGEIPKAVHLDEVDIGVIPYYTKNDGLLHNHLDMILKYGLDIKAAEQYKIRHCIGKFPGTDNHRKIRSHTEALNQMENYLNEYYPSLERIAESSTASGVKTVSEKKHGLAIGSKFAMDLYGLETIAENLGNGNYTRFWIVSKNNEPQEYKNPLTMIGIRPGEDSVGLLNKILNLFEVFEYNLTDLRPKPDNIEGDSENDVKMFYFEIEADKNHDRVQACFNAIQAAMNWKNVNPGFFNVLGTYEDPRKK